MKNIEEFTRIKKRNNLILEAITGIISIFLCLYLYDWKLLLVLIAYGAHLNFMNRGYVIKIPLLVKQFTENIIKKQGDK